MKKSGKVNKHSLIFASKADDMKHVTHRFLYEIFMYTLMYINVYEYIQVRGFLI